MSKNLFRKGLAIAAAGALGISGLIALPANAAGYGVDQDKVTLAPATGVDWAVTSYDSFSVKSRILPSATNGGTLKFFVETADSDDYDSPGSEFDITQYSPTAESWSWSDGADRMYLYFDQPHNFVTGDTVDVDGTGLYPEVDATETILVENATTISYGTSDLGSDMSGNDDTQVTLSVADHYESEGLDEEFIIFNSRQTAAGKDVTLTLDPEVTGGESVDVTAFVDVTTSGIGANEHASATQTITWIDADDVRVATDGFKFTQPVLGASSLSATIVTNPALNDYQSSYLPVAKFSILTGTSLNSTPAEDWGDDEWRGSSTTQYNSTTKVYSSKWAPGGVALEPGFYTATAYVANVFGATTIGGSQYQISAPLSATIAAGFSDAIDIAVPGTADVEAEYVYSFAGDGDNSATADIRKGSTAPVAATVTVYDLAGNPLPNSSVTLSGWSAAYTVNGAAAPLVVNTDANGEVKLTVVKVNPATAGTATVTASSIARGVTGSIFSATMNFKFGESAVYTLYDLRDNDANGIENDYSVNPGQSLQMSVAALDQWGITAPSTYRIKVVTTGEVSAIATSYLTPAQAGASFTAASNGTEGDDAFDVTFTLQNPSTGFTTGWENTSGTSSETVDVDVLNINNKVVLYDCSGYFDDYTVEPPIDEWASDCVEDTYVDSTLVTFDSRTQNILTPNDHDHDAEIIFGGRIVDSVTGLARPYATVTITGNSSMFFVDYNQNDFLGDTDNNVVKQGSITVRTNGQGRYEVAAYSNTSGYDIPVTIASGSSTATQNVTFLPVDDSKGADVVWKNPTSVKVGKTLAVQFKIVDKFGNAIHVADTDVSTGDGDSIATLNYSGPGLVLSGPGASTNGDLGEPDKLTGYYNARVLLGAKDFGVATFTVTYAKDQLNSLDRVFVTETIKVWVGPIVDVKAGAKKGRVVVDAYRAKGQTVNVFVKGTKVASFVADKAEDRFVVKGIKKGERNVTVKIVGPGKDTTKRVTVK